MKFQPVQEQVKEQEIPEVQVTERIKEQIVPERIEEQIGDIPVHPIVEDIVQDVQWVVELESILSQRTCLTDYLS